MKITVRDANFEDLKVITDFQLEMALETEALKLNRDILSAGIDSVLRDGIKARYFIAQQESESVGMLMITFEWSDWRNGWVWWIQSVYTKPGFRKMGIYRLLYDHVKGLVLNSDNIRGIRLYVDKRNVPAQRVYESLGMNGEHYTTYEWMKTNPE